MAAVDDVLKVLSYLAFTNSKRVAALLSLQSRNHNVHPVCRREVLLLNYTFKKKKKKIFLLLLRNRFTAPLDVK